MKKCLELDENRFEIHGVTAVFPRAGVERGNARTRVDWRRGCDHDGHRVIELCALPNGATNVDRSQIVEGFVEHQEIWIGETRQLQGLHARARMRDDVAVLLKDALQGPAHPIVAAGNQGERRTFLGQLHQGSSSVARLAWRLRSALAS